MHTSRYSFIGVILVSISLLIFTGCNSDDDKKDETKLSQEQADQAIEHNAGAIYALAYLVTYQARAAASGDINELQVNENLLYSLLYKRQMSGIEKLGQDNKIQDDDEFRFDYQTGCWILEYDSTDAISGYTIAISAQVCFDAYNMVGQPTTETNQMSYTVEFDFGGMDVGDDGSFSFDLGVDRHLDVTGIADYNSGIGNLVMNGSSSENVHFSAVSQNGSQSIGFDYLYTITNIIFQPVQEFPASGTIEFSIAFTATPPVQNYPNYSINGTITFDGTSVVVVNFAGYTYSMNLVSGEIY
jgi:hypothetical protein